MLHSLQNQTTRIADQAKGLSIEETLEELCNEFPGQVTFSTSFSYEDQVITHKILSNQFPISIFTLDTGRLFPETYSVWSATNEKYHSNIKAYYPDHSLLKILLQKKDRILFMNLLRIEKPAVTYAK